MSKRILFAALAITALLVSLTGTVAAAPPADNPGNGPPDFAKVVFIHYADDAAPARGGIPGPPRREGEYKYDGIHWADADVLYVNPGPGKDTGISGIPYYVNLGSRAVAFLGGIQAALQTWEDEPNSYMDFGYYGTTTAGMSAVGAGGNMDGLNVVGWKYLTDYYGEGVIAVAAYWYNIVTKELAEVDIAMNSDSSYAWWQNDSGDTAWTEGGAINAEGVPYSPENPFDVDVQNLITHESGHALVLGDLYADSNSEKTMYGYSGEFELKSRSLEPGDEAGIQAIYPVTQPTPGGGDIEIFNFYFSLQDFETEPGAPSVTWINMQGSHDVTFMLGGQEVLSSGKLGEGETWEVTKEQLADLGFNVNEAIPYHCHKHTKGTRVMAGTITFQ
jgi:hypothetical protein